MRSLFSGQKEKNKVVSSSVWAEDTIEVCTQSEDSFVSAAMVEESAQMNAPFEFTNDFAAVPTQEERALSLIEDVIWSQRMRLREEPIFAEGLRLALSKWTSLFGSNGVCKTVETGQSILAAKFANVPRKTMDQLSDDLFILASNSHKPDCPNSALASLLAGWLKANAIEELGESSVRRAARQVKSDYELFFERLLAGRKPAC